LNIIFNETKDLKLWLDEKIVSNQKKEIFSAIYDVAKTGKPKIFGKIESLNVSAFGIGLGITISLDSLVEIEERIRKPKRIYVFIDEAQKMEQKTLSYLIDILHFTG